jgi:hypothetical protein
MAQSPASAVRTPTGASALTSTRVFDASKAPRLAFLWASLTYLVATLSLAYPALTGAFLAKPHSDQYIAGYAFREFAASSLREGHGFPLWNPYLFGGMPYVAAMHGDIFYPTFLLRMFLPTDVAMTWGFIVHVFLAGVFTYVFLRSLGLGFYGSLIGGLAYMMSGNVAGLVSPGHDGKLFISALLPIALFFVVRGVRDGKHWAWGPLAIVVGLAVLSPHPQLLQYMLLVSGALGVFLAFAKHDGERMPRSRAIQRLGFAALAVIVGGAIGAIQYLPVQEYVAWSPRAGGKGWEHAISYSMPIEEIVNFYVPEFSGILDRYWGRNAIHLHSEYLGASALVLAALGLGPLLSPRQSKMRWFWVGVFVVSLLWALGGHTPFYRLVYAIVPGTKFFRAPSTMLYVVSFSVAMLVAYGVEKALRWEFSRRYLIGWAIAGIVLLVLGISGGLTNLGMSVAPDGRGDYVLDNAGALAVGSMRSFVFVAFACLTLFLLYTRRLSRNVAGSLLAATIVVDLWTVERRYWQFSPPASVTYKADAAIEFVQRQPQPVRVFSAAMEMGAAPRDPFLDNATGLMAQKIRLVLGYHGNHIARYDLLFPPQQLGNPNAWRLLNLKYIYTNKADLGVPDIKRVVGPVRNAAGSQIYLHELPGENPYAWVAPIIVKATDDQAAATVLDPRFDVRRAALFDASAAVQGETPNALPEALAINAKVASYAPGRVSIELDAAAPRGSALMVSENYYPGWSATVDGRPAVVGRADVSLMGVALPEGARRIELQFSSRPYETGKAITLGAIGLALLGALAGFLMDRRRRV